MKDDIEQNQAVSHKIKNGEYFREAMQWYNAKFVRPQSEVAQMGAFAVIAIIIIVTGMLSFFSLFPLAKNQAIIVGYDVADGHNVSIAKMVLERDSPTEGYVKYMLAEFVKAHEGYSQARFDRNKNIILNNSKESIFMDYSMANDEYNAESPIVQIGMTGSIKVDINKNDIKLIDFKKEDFQKGAKNGKAKIIFYKQINREGTQSVESKKASISFQYQEIIVDQKTHEIIQLPKIIITDYKTSSL